VRGAVARRMADLRRVLRAARARRVFRHAQRVAGADTPRAFDGRDLPAGDPECNPAGRAAPDPLVGLCIAMGFSWSTLVAAEMVAANVGRGQMVLTASSRTCSTC
jgi:hypothetical protein